MSIAGKLIKSCVRCGGRADFTVPLPGPDAKKRRGGQEKGEPPLPLIWHCHGCGHQTPLVLQRHEAI